MVLLEFLIADYNSHRILFDLLKSSGMKITSGRNVSGKAMGENLMGVNEDHKRSVFKTISWRIVSTASTMLAVYLLTGHLDFTVGVGLLDIFLRTPLYFFHERAWSRAMFGRTLNGNQKKK